MDTSMVVLIVILAIVAVVVVIALVRRARQKSRPSTMGLPDLATLRGDGPVHREAKPERDSGSGSVAGQPSGGATTDPR